MAFRNNEHRGSHFSLSKQSMRSINMGEQLLKSLYNPSYHTRYTTIPKILLNFRFKSGLIKSKSVLVFGFLNHYERYSLVY